MGAQPTLNPQPLMFRLGSNWPIIMKCADTYGKPLRLPVASARLRIASETALLLDVAAVMASPQAQFLITPAQQIGIAPGTYSWEADCTLTDGTLLDQAFGPFSVLNSLFVQF